jgi:hypothetical protein
LGAEEFAGPVVPKHDVSGVKFGGQGKLGGDSLAGLRLCHTSRYGPGQLSGGIGAYADDEIKSFFETRLEEQRYLDDPSGGWLGGHPLSP